MMAVRKLLKTMVCSAAVLLFPLTVRAQPPVGQAPTVVVRPLSLPPNAQAIGRRFWVPDLDAGFVPQGLAVQNGQIVLSGYTSTETEQSRGPCSVYWIEPDSGRVSQRLTLPPSCGHAGGIATITNGQLVVADTHALFIVEGHRVKKTIKLDGALRGSFADFDGHDLWLGNYARSNGTLWRIPLNALAKDKIGETSVAETLPAPAKAQGLAFDREGQLWMTTSGSKEGAIHRVDRRTGLPVATYAAPAGIEDIAFDAHGVLWATSEAGSRRWSTWPTFYPVLFAVAVGLLK